MSNQKKTLEVESMLRTKASADLEEEVKRDLEVEDPKEKESGETFAKILKKGD